MTFFLGTTGNIRLKREAQATLLSAISSYDINVSLARLGFDGSQENLLTGDKLTIRTEDPRGLICFPASTWSSNQVENTIAAYVNVNPVGGLRFFDNFESAINNDRTQEYPLTSFVGDQIEIEASVRDSTYRVLGNVRGYNINTDRDAVETTSLSDKFRKQHSAGLISGSGSLDCFFSKETTGIQETPLFVLQLIQRLEIGSTFDCALYLTEQEGDNVYYEFTALVTRSGVEVQPTEIISCTIDFVTTGEIKLLVGTPSGYILQENSDRIVVEPSLDFLLKEVED